MSWYNRNPELYEAEMSAVRRRFPDVRTEVYRGYVCFEGLFPVRTKNGSTLRRYGLCIVFPRNYPQWIPDSYMMEPNVKFFAERHIDRSGRACLCLPHEVPSYFPEGVRFDAYIDHLLTPWLIGQAYYDEYDDWPWPTRKHGRKGILQGFSELLAIEDLSEVERYVHLLVRKNPAKGHEMCPCDSGRKLRDCHSDLYYRCRENLPKEAITIYRKLFF